MNLASIFISSHGYLYRLTYRVQFVCLSIDFESFNRVALAIAERRTRPVAKNLPDRAFLVAIGRVRLSAMANAAWLKLGMVEDYR